MRQVSDPVAAVVVELARVVAVELPAPGRGGSPGSSGCRAARACGRHGRRAGRGDGRAGPPWSSSWPSPAWPPCFGPAAVLRPGRDDWPGRSGRRVARARPAAAVTVELATVVGELPVPGLPSPCFGPAAAAVEAARARPRWLARPQWSRAWPPCCGLDAAIVELPAPGLWFAVVRRAGRGARRASPRPACGSPWSSSWPRWSVSWARAPAWPPCFGPAAAPSRLPAPGLRPP